MNGINETFPVFSRHNPVHWQNSESVNMELAAILHPQFKLNPMAEISSQPQQGGSVNRRSIKRSVKIDMTPMVDLAFLLLTFFILTSTFHDPRVLELPMPDKNSPGSPVQADNVLNLVLAEDNKIYWWSGIEGRVATTSYSNKGLRKLLIQQMKDKPKLMVLIKPHDKSKYENVVDVLDEITITQLQRYAIVDFNEEDQTKIASIGH